MKRLLILTAMLSVATTAGAVDPAYLATALSRTRALAMGSAVHSLVDDFSAGLYNPAAFRLNNTRDERPFRLFFDPMSAAVAVNDFRRVDIDFRRDDEMTPEETTLAAAMLLKGMVVATPMFDIGVNFAEALIPGDSLGTIGGRLFSARDVASGSMHAAFVNFKVASTVSLGLTGTAYRVRAEGKTSFYGGYTFGVLLNPNPKLMVGIAYHDIPSQADMARFALESIEGKTVTSGISYYPDDHTVLSIDLRNLNRDDKLASREIHLGFERRLFDRIAFRGGYYREKATENDVYSLGVGILPVWGRISRNVNTTRNDILSYALIMEENGHRSYWHAVSLLFRF